MWKLNTADRLDSWKRLRTEITQLDIETALQKVVDAWSTAPWQPFYLNYDESKEWPDPWTLIEENYYCDLAKALGMLYTLHLSGHKDCEHMELLIMHRESDHGQYNIVVVNEKYVLNLEHGEIVNKKSIPIELCVTKCYTKEHLSLERF